MMLLIAILSLIIPANTYAIKVPVTVIQAEISAYTSRPEETDDTPFTTAWGTKTRDGIMANNCWPLGTLVKYRGRTYRVEDRMNRRYGCEVFDVWMSDYEAALAFGRQKGDITIME